MNSMTIQNQVRQNADELQDFLRDLNEWKNDIRREDRTIQAQAEGLAPKDIPPIRGTTGSKKKKIDASKSKNKHNKKEIEKPGEKPIIAVATTTTEKVEPISMSNYDAWDKFDADAACDELDLEEEEAKAALPSSSEEESEEEDLELERRKEQALEEKEKGNVFYYKGDISSAIECYTRGMLCDATNPILPANRAMALLKNEQYATAEQDCGLAIALDSAYVKAYHRRATARAALENMEGARDDLQMVLKLDSGNVQAMLELKKISQGINDVKTKITGKKTLKDGRRVPILDVDSSSKLRPSPDNADERHTQDKHIWPGDGKPGLILPVKKPAHLRSKKPIKRIQVLETGNDPEVVPAALTSDRAEEKESPPDDPKEVAEAKDAVTMEEVSLPEVPLTSYQLRAHWRRLQPCPELLYQYLKNIPCEQYPALFQNSLESDILSGMLRVYRDFYVRDGLDVVIALESLTRVQRFCTLTMFLSADDKAVIQSLLEYSQQSGCSLDRVTRLRQTYGL